MGSLHASQKWSFSEKKIFFWIELSKFMIKATTQNQKNFCFCNLTIFELTNEIWHFESLCPGFYYVKKPKRFVILSSDKSSERNLSCFFDIIKPRRMEHLQSEEPFSSDPYFRLLEMLICQVACNVRPLNCLKQPSSHQIRHMSINLTLFQ